MVYHKVPASEVCIGDYFTTQPKCAFNDYNKSKKGKSYKEFYGEDKAKEIKETISEINKEQGKWRGENNPSYGGLSQMHKVNIGLGLKGHYVSENCRKAPSERWKGENNPVHFTEQQILNPGNIRVTISPYENDFKGELEALGLSYVHQFIVPGTRKVADFFIKDKNLIIELETRYSSDVCGYNDSIESCEDYERYQEFINLGYNVLVFNPSVDHTSYRKYINNLDKIVSIECIPYNGFVYDVEVETFDSGRFDPLFAHTFYSNGILTGNCCRLRLDLRELRRRNGGFFGSGDSTGSIGVVTINLPRLAYIAKVGSPEDREKEFYSLLDKYMSIAKDSLVIKRDFLNKKVLNSNMIPAFKEYVGTLDNHFSTIGLIGMNEMCMNLFGEGIVSVKGKEFSIEVLKYMREKLADYQEETGDFFNLEATPAESTCYRLAKKDVEEFGDKIYTQSHDDPYYTNSCHLPVKDVESIKQLFDHQDDLQCLFTGGTVVHTYLEGSITGEQAKHIVKTICENYKLPYISLSPLVTTCPVHGLLHTNADKCPTCGATTLHWQRITGYIRQINNADGTYRWNKGKVAEFKDRHMLKAD